MSKLVTVQNVFTLKFVSLWKYHKMGIDGLDAPIPRNPFCERVGIQTMFQPCRFHSQRLKRKSIVLLYHMHKVIWKVSASFVKHLRIPIIRALYCTFYSPNTFRMNPFRLSSFSSKTHRSRSSSHGIRPTYNNQS